MPAYDDGEAPNATIRAIPNRKSKKEQKRNSPSNDKPKEE